MIMTLSGLETLLKTVTPDVYHFEAEKAQPPYIVYSEYRKNLMHADNKPKTGMLRVQVECYTKNRKDPAAGQVESLMAENEIPYRYMVSYDPDMRLVRHLFDCEVKADGQL